MKFAVRSTVAALVAALVLGLAGSAEAKMFSLFGKAEEPLPPGVVAAPGVVMAAPASAVMTYAAGAPCCGPVCPTPCIKYRNAWLDCKVRCCDPCKPPVQAVLHVKNPCTCCPVDVPVCLPNCCCGEPKIDCKKTLLGDGMVSYSWCCGVTVNIRFDRCGDVLVTYRGT